MAWPRLPPIGTASSQCPGRRAVAVSGGVRSAPSSVLPVKTLPPPVSAGGWWTVDEKVVQTTGGNLKVGGTETDTWQFTPKCTTGACSVMVSGGLQTVASRVHFREQYRALVGHALVWARVLLLLRALSVPGDTV